MDEINRNVLRMIKASDVGKMLSSADMALLETELESTPAQRVGGWLGEQIAKAARQQMAKGDFTGHPFRGNQWSDSSGTGAGSSGASAGSGKGTGGKRYAVSELVAGDFVEITTKDNVYLGEVFRNKNGVLTMDDENNDVVNIKIEDIELIDNEKVLDEAESSDEGPDKATRQANIERRVKIEADKKKIDDQAARQRQKREASRQGKVKIDQDNIDAPLKAEEATEYKAQHKNAVKALKTTTSLISKLRAAANDLPKKFRDAAFMELQQALDDTDRWADNLQSAGTKPTIRGAVKMSYIGTNIGESVKGSIRVAMDEINSGRKAEGKTSLKFDTLDDSALQDASDRNFGVPDSKYDREGAMDIIDGE
jgi:hypothetical protein